MAEHSDAYVVAVLLGPPIAGWLIAILLFGVYLTVHTRYCRGPLYRQARREVRIVVWLTFALLTGYIALSFAEVLYWTCTAKRSADDVSTGTRLDTIYPLFAGLVGAVVQGLLTARASSMIQNRAYRIAVVVVLSIGIVAALLGAIFNCAVLNMYLDDTLTFGPAMDYTRAIAMHLWASAGTDILISITLAVTLRRRIAGFNAQTDGLLHKLVVNGLQTAAYTAIVALIGAIFSSIFGDSDNLSQITMLFWGPLPACYGLSLYTTLQSRQTVNQHLGGGPSSIQHRPVISTSAVPSSRVQPVSLQGQQRCSQDDKAGVEKAEQREIQLEEV
ncbi:hypothetical protein JCM10207_001860 [Rhodosporidiobolus poonsookiae]